LVSFLESLAGSLIGTLTRNSDDESRILLMDYCVISHQKPRCLPRKAVSYRHSGGQ
jgi:hypothetical protein